ncbi:MAG: fibronectin type III domain-containing protein [Leptothrix sp. (in: b-proteobacteria)]
MRYRINLGAIKRAIDEVFQIKVRTVIKKLSGNPNFPLPWPASITSIEQLEAGLDKFAACCEAALQRDSSKIRARNDARDQLHVLIDNLVPYIEAVAHDNLDILESSGFEVRSTTPVHATSTDPLPAPTDFRVVHGNFSGTLVVHVARSPGAKLYEVEISQNGGSVDAKWDHATVSSSGMHIVVDGLMRGQDIWVRVRAHNKDGPGQWTAPINVMVV